MEPRLLGREVVLGLTSRKQKMSLVYFAVRKYGGTL
jgi:hypothetical protein